MVDETEQTVKNVTRTVLLRMMGDGGLLQESAPLQSVELSQSAAQAKEAGQAWAVTVKVYDVDVRIAGANAWEEMQLQLSTAKAEPL